MKRIEKIGIKKNEVNKFRMKITQYTSHETLIWKRPHKGINISRHLNSNYSK
jgi:hypothetical protein